MRVPRLTTRRLMAFVAVVAVDFGLIVGARRLIDVPTPLDLLLPAVILVPSLSLVILAAASALLGLAKHRRAPPFAAGYLLLGGLVSFGVCLSLATQTFQFLAVTVETAPAPIPEPSPWEDAFGLCSVIAIATVPQLVPALIGGALAARYGFTMVLTGRDSTTSPDGAAADRPGRIEAARPDAPPE